MPKYLGTSNDDKDLVTKGYVETKIQGIVQSLTNYVLNSKLANYVLKTDLVNYSKTSHRHDNATTTGDGFLSKEDKTKLDTVESNANNYVHPSSHPYSMITGTPTSLPASGGNADTVNNKTVEANVPSNAKFTDTITTVNGKTGAVTKADIVALGIPGQDTNTTYSNATTTDNGLMSNTDKVKLDGVAANANNYAHPSTHPASIISETSTKRFVSDAEKNTWNNKQNDLGFVPENSTNKGKVNGYASLDANGKVPASELPSYVDDVMEATTLANLPTTGETGKIYVTTNDNKTYRWSGTAYAEISASLALGTTSSTAYRGDLGNTAYSHSQATGNPHGTTKAQIGLGSVDNTSDANKPVSTATQTELDKKVNNSQVLTDVPLNAKFTDTIYSHPSTHPASMIVETSTKRFATDAEKANWNSKTDDSTVNSHVAENDNPHDVTKAQVGLGNVDNTNDLSKPVSTATQDALDLKADKSQVLTNVPVGAKFTDTVYTHPTSHPASMITESTTKRFVSDTEKATWNGKTDDTTANAHIAKIDNPHSVTKAQVGLGSVSNIAQASKTEFDAHVGDATHATIEEKNSWNAKQDTIIAGTNLTKSGNTLNATDTKYNNATTTVSGLMSNTDKTKLDSVASGANNYVHPSSHPASIITESTTKRFVTDAEKAIWNAKQNELVAGSNVTISGNTISATDTNTTYGVATTTVNGLMAATDKVKLNGIAANANNYTHPSSHPASIITQDASNRFTTDTEKAIWNGKQNSLTAGSNITISGNTISATNTNTTYNNATTSTSGLMASTDKSKLDGIATGANNYTHPSTHPYSMITGTPTSLPANGGSATSAEHLLGDDTRSIDSEPSVYMSTGSRYGGRAGWQTEFKYVATLGAQSVMTGTYCYLQTHTPWSDSSGGYPIQVIYGASSPSWRVGTSNTAWSAWTKLADGGNASTVNGKTVLVDVPSNAKFTDTNTTYSLATTSANGLMAAADKVKLNGIATGANNYTHPSSHPASIITQDASNRFVTDSEKATWNGKQNSLTAGSNITISGSTISATNTNTTYGVATTTTNGLMSSADKSKLDGVSAGATTDATANTHIANKSNPHAVTKAQVSLGSVLNYGLATQAEAQAGTSNVKYMTPLLTKQAITSQTSGFALKTEIPSVNGFATFADITNATANTTNQRDGSSVKLWIGTQAQYNAITTKDNTVMYMVTI